MKSLVRNNLYFKGNQNVWPLQMYDYLYVSFSLTPFITFQWINDLVTTLFNSCILDMFSLQNHNCLLQSCINHFLLAYELNLNLSRCQYWYLRKIFAILPLYLSLSLSFNRCTDAHWPKFSNFYLRNESNIY